VIIQKNNAGTVAARYFRGLAIDEPWLGSNIGAATTNRVYLADALGSVVALTDSSGVISNEYDYEPFTVVTNIGLSLNSYKFTAREDDGTGLYYYRARYFHPALGRFVSEDPMDMVDGPNVYLYARNNSLAFSDPFGTVGEPLVTIFIIHRVANLEIPQGCRSPQAFQHCYANCVSAKFLDPTLILGTEAPATLEYVLPESIYSRLRPTLGTAHIHEVRINWESWWMGLRHYLSNCYQMCKQRYCDKCP